MNIDEERMKIGKFVKAGLFGLSLVLLATCAVRYIPKAVETFRGTGKTVDMPIRSVDLQEKKIALSFDLSATNKGLKETVNVLKEQGIPATFFVTKDWVKKYPRDLKALSEAGYDIQNHGLKNERMQDKTEEECKKSIESVHQEVKSITGKDMFLFRAPYGEFNEGVMAACKSEGYLPVKWNIDSMDWKDYGVDAIINQVCNNKELKNGSIILCHPSAKFTKSAVELVIHTVQKRGYQFVPVSELVYHDHFKIDSKGRQQPISN